MNESTSSHSCFLRNVPHLHHLQCSHNRDQRSKRHSKVSLRRQLQQPDPTDLQEKLCTAGSLTGPRNDDRIFCLYCRSISDHKKYNVCIYLYRYQKQHIKDILLHIPGVGRTPCFVDTNLCPHPPSLQNVFFPALYVYQSHVSRVFSKNSSPLDFPRFPRKSLQNTFGFGALIEIPKIFLFCRDPLW